MNHYDTSLERDIAAFPECFALQQISCTIDIMASLTIIKKYANRRLYDTGKSSYVTLDDIAVTLREGHDIKIVDADTGKEITKSVLLQILLEQETTQGRSKLLTKTFLKELVKLYESPFEAFIPFYLEQAMKNFMQSREKLRSSMDESFGDMMPSNESMTLEKQKQEILQRTMQMFTPFNGIFDPNEKDEKTPSSS